MYPLQKLGGGLTAILQSKFDQSLKQHNLLTCQKMSEQVRPHCNFNIPLWAQVIVPTWQKTLDTGYLHQKLIKVTLLFYSWIANDTNDCSVTCLAGISACIQTMPKSE